MTRLSCPTCRLRFASAAALHLKDCPECGRALHPVAAAEAALGYRLFVAIDSPPAPSVAAEMAVPIHVHRPDRP